MFDEEFDYRSICTNGSGYSTADVNVESILETMKKLKADIELVDVVATYGAWSKVSKQIPIEPYEENFWTRITAIPLTLHNTYGEAMMDALDKTKKGKVFFIYEDKQGEVCCLELPKKLTIPFYYDPKPNPAICLGGTF